MPFTKEQKKAYRLKRKQEEALKQQQEGQKLQALSPPNKELKRPYQPKHLGNNKVDYGGHQKALNFPMKDVPRGELQLALKGEATSMHNNSLDEANVKRIGDLSIGLVYEGDWKQKSHLAGNGEKQMCDKSQKYLEFLLHVKEMLWPKVHETLKHLMDDSMRVNILCGAQTLPHTDSYRGNTPNFLYIVPDPKIEPGWLCYDRFPRFKVSVVKMAGQYYIPHSYSHASDEVRCIGCHPSIANKPIFYVFKSGAIDSMEAVGDLPYGVVGWKANGEIQVVPEFEDVCLYTKPLIFWTVSWNELVEEALKKPAKKPTRRIVKLQATGKWHEFRAYTYRHWWAGNHIVERYHVFFRTIREVPTSSNLVRNGKRINYIDGRTSPTSVIH
jgi:hypothetical protein